MPRISSDVLEKAQPPQLRVSKLHPQEPLLALFILLWVLTWSLLAFSYIVQERGFFRGESDLEPLHWEMILDNLCSVQSSDPKAGHMRAAESRSAQDK